MLCVCDLAKFSFVSAAGSQRVAQASANVDRSKNKTEALGVQTGAVGVYLPEFP